MRMSRSETCIVPDCQSLGGAKPIYIQITVDGRRTWKKIGGLCKNHLPQRVLRPGDSTVKAGEKVTIPHDFPGQDIVDQVLPQEKIEDAKLSVADWREISELGKKVLPGIKDVDEEEEP